VDDFAELYSAQFHALTIQLYAYTSDFAQAQDLVQEAFARAVPKWNELKTYDDPAAWVRKVAFNLAASRWRRRRTALEFARRQREEHTEGPTPDRVALTEALATLPANQRRTIVLHYLADLTVAEIARQDNIPEGTVKSWLSRGRTTLAAYLTDPREARHV
jgi:RNA polymerase sigma-70 factor (ECF subfamily)